jgi:hypothetical protein
LGGFALFGAVGSTIALHYVFGPYILDMTKVVVKSSSSSSDCNDEGSDTTTTTTTTTTRPIDGGNSNGDFILQVHTRSVFGWKILHTINPSTDQIVSPYQGFRPFGNFSVNDKPYYVHPELLQDDNLRRTLLPGYQEQQQAIQDNQRQLHDKEGLSTKDKDDDFF